MDGTIGGPFGVHEASKHLCFWRQIDNPKYYTFEQYLVNYGWGSRRVYTVGQLPITLGKWSRITSGDLDLNRQIGKYWEESFRIPKD